MHDAFPVRFVQRVGYFQSQLQRFVQRHGATFKARRQRLAFEIFHDEIVGTVLLANVVQHTDMRVIQRSQRLRFTLEALPHLGIRRPMLWKYFDGDDALQSRVRRFVDFAHSTGSDLVEDLVWAETCADLKGAHRVTSRKAGQLRMTVRPLETKPC
jgi:hypothetical protein